MKRFAIMVVLGAMLCGSLVAGCGGGDDAESNTTGGNLMGGNGAGGGNTTGAGAGADAGDE